MATQIISIERQFTETELAERGKEQAHLLAEIDQLESQKKQAADDFKAQIGGLQERVNEITLEINRGFARSDAKCDVLLNTPEVGKKTYINVETGATEKVEDMTPTEMQSKLFDEDEREDDKK